MTNKRPQEHRCGIKASKVVFLERGPPVGAGAIGERSPVETTKRTSIVKLVDS
jgi:hypothetical protein